MLRLTRDQGGFTLVELLGVLAVIAFALAISLPELPSLDHNAATEEDDTPVTQVVYYTLVFEEDADPVVKERELRDAFATQRGEFLELLRSPTDAKRLCVGLWVPGTDDPRVHLDPLREITGAKTVSPTDLTMLVTSNELDEDEADEEL